MLNRLLPVFLVFLAANSAHSLMLGTTEVPREKIIVYLMIGHSNMGGADYRRADGVTHPRAWNYQFATSKTWVPAREIAGRTGAGGLAARGSGGPSMPFLKQMAAAYPEYYFGVINNASPSSTCRGENTGNNGSNLEADENRYWKGTVLYNELLTAAKAVQGQVTLGGIVLMLGAVEATRTPETVCRAFSSDIAQLVKDLRADLNAPRLPFLMGEYEYGAEDEFARTLPRPSIIDAETKLVPTKLEQSVTINSQGIDMLDNHHYSATLGQPEFAKRVVAAIKAKNWFPPPSGTSIAFPALKQSLSGSRARLSMDFSKSQSLEIIGGNGNLYLVDGKLQNFKRDNAIIQP